MYWDYDSNHEYSHCDKVKARKEYKCDVTGKTILVGEEYYRMSYYYPRKRDTRVFHFKLSVGKDVRNEFRRSPDVAINTYGFKPVLGFFN